MFGKHPFYQKTDGSSSELYDFRAKRRGSQRKQIKNENHVANTYTKIIIL